MNTCMTHLYCIHLTFLWAMHCTFMPGEVETSDFVKQRCRLTKLKENQTGFCSWNCAKEKEDGKGLLWSFGNSNITVKEEVPYRVGTIVRWTDCRLIKWVFVHTIYAAKNRKREVRMQSVIEIT